MTNAKKPKMNAVPQHLSDHDQRSEQPATEKHWDDESRDPAAKAGEHLSEFRHDAVPLSDEDWEKEEALDDEIPDHLDAAIDRTVSLEKLAEEEFAEDEEE